MKQIIEGNGFKKLEFQNIAIGLYDEKFWNETKTGFYCNRNKLYIWIIMIQCCNIFKKQWEHSLQNTGAGAGEKRIWVYL